MALALRPTPPQSNKPASHTWSSSGVGRVLALGQGRPLSPPRPTAALLQSHAAATIHYLGTKGGRNLVMKNGELAEAAAPSE